MSLVDDVLMVGSYGNFIEPAIALLRDLLQRGKPFGVGHIATTRKQDIKKALKNFGVDYWGIMPMFELGCWSVSVPSDQRALACAAFEYYEIVVQYSPVVCDPPETVVEHRGLFGLFSRFKCGYCGAKVREESTHCPECGGSWVK